MLKEKHKVTQAVFFSQIGMPWEKLAGQTEGSLRLELLWCRSVCLTDHIDLQAKTCSAAPILTRELPEGI